MDAKRFDRLTLSLANSFTRRGILSGLGSASLGFLYVARPIPGVAKKKKKTQIGTPNAFGCLSVGQKCGGRSDLCCSGICAGKKPKKGKNDKRKCAAHNTGGCVPAQDTCAAGQPVHCATFGSALARPARGDSVPAMGDYSAPAARGTRTASSPGQERPALFIPAPARRRPPAVSRLLPIEIEIGRRTYLN